MRKFLEMTAAHSCMTKAGDDEMTFVLLSRDAAAPVGNQSLGSGTTALGQEH